MTYDDNFINSSDDDLFEDNETTKSKDIADALRSHLKDEHSIDIDTSDLLTDVETASNRARIAIALYEAAGRWSAESNSISFVKATHDTLDSLTNGHFSKVTYFYKIELEIVQMHTIQSVLQALCSGDFESLKEINEKLHIHIDSHFINVYWRTMLAIIAHLLEFKTNLYVAMAKDLNLPINQSAVDYDNADGNVYRQHAFFTNRIHRSVSREYVKDLIKRQSESKN